jgi:DNA-binding MarR family transcriptional regulator
MDSYDRLRAKLGRSRDGSRATEIVSRLYRLLAHVDRKLVDIYKRHDLTHGEAATLLMLTREDEPTLSPSDLAAQVMCSTGAMTNRLDQLEARGLIRRLPNPHDRRGSLIGLTPAGLARISAASEDRYRLGTAIIPGLSLADRQTLVGLLRKALAAYEASEGGPRRRTS